jgi:hypothetical protein
MGNSNSTIQKVSFEDVQQAINISGAPTLINTLPADKQECLIPNTIPVSQEESVVNAFLKNGNTDIRLIVYGINCNDDTMFIKYNQLISLGFKNIGVYVGGLFEWLLLQDVVGVADFPTTKKVNELEFLNYKAKCRLDT